VGFFPNVTHAQALTAQDRGTFAAALPGVKVKFVAFNAGPSAMEALFGDSVDVVYVGPTPALNAFVRSRSRALRVVAGACSGGAGLVARPEAGIRVARDLAGKRLLTPQLANTQDVAARTWLIAGGAPPDDRGGPVKVTPVSPADGLNLFRQGIVVAAWVPEPWTSRYMMEAGGVLVADERTLWPDGKFATTVLVASTRALERAPSVVEALVAAHVDETDWIVGHPAEARAAAARTLERVARIRFPPGVLEAAWERMDVTVDPMAKSVTESLRRSQALGFLPPDASEDGFYDLRYLNRALAKRGRPEVTP
jgi:NitT/TauT family transport system substrate-binding protein